ncbi:metallophosphoesterase [Clostridium cavendishii]|uniref:metallophosphoesterase n=1 Tax=Clostridium cavendishii TaxID=349931 RepID=UPI001A9A5AC0|nr:metallophosphoesterase [Clostridium cavendishii]
MITIFIYYENNVIDETKVNIINKKIPKNFNGYKIIHISDLHSKSFGYKQKRLVDRIKSNRPDLIFITGDFVDSRNYDEKPCLALIKEIKNIAPIYYVTGNHESRSGKSKEFCNKLSKFGVNILLDKYEYISLGEDRLNIFGIFDASVKIRDSKREIETRVNEKLDKIKGIRETELRILLAHRPEYFKNYKEAGFDIIFSGHAHGGQWRLPIIGGLMAPAQGWFPKYTSGVHVEDGKQLIISRGLGNSAFPIRLFNHPELIIVNLKDK